MAWLQQDQDLPWLDQLPNISTTGLSCDSGYEDDDSSLSPLSQSFDSSSFSLDFLLESTKLVDGPLDLDCGVQDDLSLYNICDSHQQKEVGHEIKTEDHEVHCQAADQLPDLIEWADPSSQLDWTMLTHWGGLMSLAERAGFGSRNLVSLMVGLWSMSAARWRRAATLEMSKTHSCSICSPGMTSRRPSR